MEDAIAKARAFVAARKIEAPLRARASSQEWDTWANVARVLRSTNTRIDHRGMAAPMKWDQVVEYIQHEFPNSKNYGCRTLRSKLSVRLKRHEKTPI